MLTAPCPQAQQVCSLQTLIPTDSHPSQGRRRPLPSPAQLDMKATSPLCALVLALLLPGLLFHTFSDVFLSPWLNLNSLPSKKPL